MLSDYLDAAIRLARYDILEDMTFYGEVAELPGVWADGTTLEECRTTLREVIEDWIVLSLRAGDTLPVLSGVDLNAVGRRVA